MFGSNNNSFLWIIIILVILFLFCGRNNSGVLGDDCGCSGI